MRARKRSGFTLVELMVVVVIIGLLVALIVPAVNAARSAARRATCMNNERELGLAVLQYEIAREHFPGYANANGTSWVPQVFKYLGKPDLWRRYRGGMTAEQGEIVPQLVCPDDDVRGIAPLSYVGNCGQAADVADRDPTIGIFLDQSNPTGDESNEGGYYTISVNDISDGTQSTLMLGENAAGVHQWNTATVDSVGFTFGGSAEQISSNHAGGANVIYCDGHGDFLTSSMDPAVYASLMHPHDGVASQ